MISQARLKRKTHASPNGIASGLKRKREEDEVDGRVKRQYEYIQEGGGESMLVVNTRDFHRKPAVSQSGPRTPQRRNTIAMGDLRSSPMPRESSCREVDAEETRISSRTKPPPPMRTTSLKTVTATVTTNELIGSNGPAEIPFEGTLVQRWSSEQNPDADIKGPERPSSSNAVLESWYTSNHLSQDQELASYEHATQTSNGPRNASSSLSPTTNGFVTPEANAESKLLVGKTRSRGLSVSLAPGLRAALVSRLESCLIDLGSPGDNMTLAR